MVCLEDPANAGCQLEPIEISDLCTADLLMDLLQLLVKVFRRHVGQNQKKFIAAVADQDIRFADARKNRLGCRTKRLIPRMMTIQVVVQLKIIQINDYNPPADRQQLDLVLIIPAVINPGQCICVQALIVILHKGLQRIRTTGIQLWILIQLTEHLQHIRFAVHLHISCKHLTGHCAPLLQAAPSGPILQRLICNPVSVLFCFQHCPLQNPYLCEKLLQICLLLL